MPHDRDTDATPPSKSRPSTRPWPAVVTLPPVPAGNAPEPPANGDDPERWTVKRILNWTKDYLEKRGAECPRLDAEVLLAHVLGWQRVQLYTHFEEEVGTDARRPIAS